MVPRLALDSFLQGPGSRPEIVAWKPCVFYLYPGGVRDGEEPAWTAEDRAEHCGFRDFAAALKRYDVSVIGVSGESAALQGSAHLRLKVVHALFSDPWFKLADALGLPTTEWAGRRFYRRAILLTVPAGRIVQAHCPVDEPARVAERLYDRLRLHGRLG